MNDLLLFIQRKTISFLNFNKANKITTIKFTLKTKKPWSALISESSALQYY